MITLDYPTVVRLIQRLNFKPNVNFIVTGKESSSARIEVIMYVPDSTRPQSRVVGKPDESMYSYWDFAATMGSRDRARYSQTLHDLIPVSGKFPVPYEMPELIDFWKWLRYTVLRSLDDHESDEWFKVDGVAIFDPHKTPEYFP